MSVRLTYQFSEDAVNFPQQNKDRDSFRNVPQSKETSLAKYHAITYDVSQTQRIPDASNQRTQEIRDRAA